MARKSSKVKSSGSTTQGVIKGMVLVISCLIAFGCLVLPDILSDQNDAVRVGQVAPQEITAPFSITFESKVLTDQARKEAAADVEPVFLPADPSIARAQLENLNTTLYFFTSIRNDKFSTQQQKVQDMRSAENLSLTDEAYEGILSLSDEEWQAITMEANRVLEIVLRDSIRNDQLGPTRSNLPAIIDFGFKSDQTQLITMIVTPMIVPTSLFSEEQTQQAKDVARNTVEPITRQIMAGEVLVRRGQVIGYADLESLNVFGLGEPENRSDLLLTSGLLVALCGFICAMYYNRRRKFQALMETRTIIMLAIFFLTFLAFARFLVMDRTVIPWLYPIAAFGLTVAIVLRVETGMLLSLLLAILTVFGHPRDMELALFYILPTFAGIFVIGRARRISSFLGAGAVVSLVGIAAVLIFRIGDSFTDWLGLVSLMASALFNGFASGTLTILFEYVFSFVLDIPTALQLMDISRPDHPLMQQVLQTMPGSYQHSLQVSNLAEQAAEAIGADRLLVRVGALYHDVGKSENPGFFIENQVRGNVDPHDDIPPEVAAATIIKHVTDGVALAKRYRLPSRVTDFIREHHGTLMTRYQYGKALAVAENPEDVDPTLFTYPGPAPRSKETAILMLADGTEARSRANTARTDEEIRDVINSVISVCKDAGQFDNTDLTLKDLSTIRESFFNTLQRSYHPRIQYPETRRGKTEPVNITNQTQTPAEK
jgi:putative nucleotidyltransferase with HDIG domain